MAIFCNGGTLPLKADEAKVKDNTMDKYPFCVPKVVLEGYSESRIPQTTGSWDGNVVNLIREDEIIEYTQLDYVEGLIEDKEGNIFWADMCPVSPEAHIDGEELGIYRSAKKYLITEYDLEAMKTKRYKVVLDKTEAFTEWDFCRLEMILNGEILDTHYVVNDGILERLIGEPDDLLIPDSVIEINESLLCGHRHFKTILIPEKLIDIPDTFFKNCSAECVSVADGNPKYYVENGCLIDGYTATLVWAYAGTTIPDDGSIKRIGANAFGSGPDIKSIVIPDSVTEIETGAFRGCYLLEEIRLPDLFADRVEDIFEKKLVKEGDIWKIVKAKRVERDFSGFSF